MGMLETHDSVHIEVKVIKLDAVRIWSGNVDWELEEFTEGIWDLDFVFFPDRCHWGKWLTVRLTGEVARADRSLGTFC